eukprot:6743573-Pyramimonas_sp.AAC.1
MVETSPSSWAVSFRCAPASEASAPLGALGPDALATEGVDHPAEGVVRGDLIACRIHQLAPQVGREPRADAVLEQKIPIACVERGIL